jgi:hypothetical protein
MSAVIDFAKSKEFSSFTPLVRFAKPVSLLRLVLVIAFLLVEWKAFAFIVNDMGLRGGVQSLFSLAPSLVVTYFLFPFLKMQKRESKDSTVTE